MLGLHVAFSLSEKLPLAVAKDKDGKEGVAFYCSFKDSCDGKSATRNGAMVVSRVDGARATCGVSATMNGNRELI